MLGGSQVHITGGTFTEIQGDCIYHHNHTTEIGLNTLSQFTSPGAIHDSSERFPPPKCHPDTRHEVIKLAMEWIEEEDSDASVFWIYGPAGAGKSALAQTLAELIQAAGRSYGGSFFFSRGKLGRDQAHHLFTTIAYQLAFHIPDLRAHLNQIIYANPTLPTKPINVQMQTLIVEPLARLNGSLQTAPIIIVDGLDECNGHDAQQLILTVIAEALSKAHTPLRFLVSSRPEAHIRETFDSDLLRTITRRLVLDECFEPNNDIKIYLRDGFDIIYEQHKQFMGGIEKPWPSDGVIDLLVQNASGQFIYAATVLKFVSEEYYRPNKRLDIVLQPTPRRSTAFPDLDALYTQILSTCPDRPSLLLILGAILSFHCPQPPEVIEDILDMDRNEVNLVLRSLRSLVRIPGIEGRGSQHDKKKPESEEGNGLQFYHASFNDFLVDEDRSGPFYINLQEFLPKFTTSSFRTILRFIPATVMSLNTFDSQPHHLPVICTWGYLKWHLSPHFWSCPEPVRSAIIHDLEAGVQHFCVHTLDGKIAEVSFDALHCVLTALAHMMYTIQEWDELRHTCDGNSDLTLEQLVKERRQYPEKKLDETLAAVFYKYRKVLDACYAKEFSGSCSRINELITSIPGFLVLQGLHTVENVAAILGTDVEIVRNLVEKNRLFFRFHPYSNSIVPNAHMKDYLCDQSRSGHYYHDPKPHHISIARRGLSLVFAEPWSVLDNSGDDVRYYFYYLLWKHLDNSDIGPLDNLSSGDPVMDLIEDLNRFDYCHEDHWNTSEWNLFYSWSMVLYVLQWLRCQQEALAFEDQYADIYVKMEERLRLTTDRIFGQILFSVRLGNETVITLSPPFLEMWESLPLSSGNPCPKNSSRIVKAAGTLKMGEYDQTPNTFISASNFPLLQYLVPSLADYLTDPYRAGDLFMRPEIFHMQFALYMLDQFLGHAKVQFPEDLIEGLKRQYSDRHLRLHLIQAQPSEHIYAKLRTINLPNFFKDSGSLMDFMKAVVTWLEGHPQPPLDIYIKFQKNILQMEADERERIQNQLTLASSDAVDLDRKSESIRRCPSLSFLVDWRQLNWRIFLFFGQLYLAVLWLMT